MFTTFPLAFVLGFGAFIAPLWGSVMAAYLFTRGDVRFPRAMLMWWMFLATVVASLVMLDSVGRLIGGLYRLSNYGGATIAFLYVYNSREWVLPDRRIVKALVVFWLCVVAGGYLGVLWPEGSFSTPLERVIPGALLGNELVADWVRPNFAEVQQPWGAPEPFARPSAPFPYTNGWGNNFALLTPFVIAMVGLMSRRRVLLVVALLAALVPAGATLNRGMFTALGLALGYTAIRLLFRGRAKLFVAMLGVAAVVGAAVVTSGVLEQIALRTSYSSTTLDRTLIYRETLIRTMNSPFVGWGGPRPSRTLGISVGTQGHVWNVMFSHGFVALVFFVVTLWWLAWRTRRCTGLAFTAHVVLVVVSVAIVYYGYDGPQMVVAMVAAGLAMRQVDQPLAEPEARAGPAVAIQPSLAVAARTRLAT